MQHETSMFPASLGDPFDYPMTSEYPNKQWSAFGELNPYTTLNLIDEEHFNIDSDSSCPQFNPFGNSSSPALPIDDNLVDQGRIAPGDAPTWYHDNLDVGEVLGDLKYDVIQSTPTPEEDHSKFIKDNAVSIPLLASASASAPLKINLTNSKQEVNIKKRKKNEEEEKDKKKEVSKKKKTQIQIQEDIEESDEDSGDNPGTQPKLTRKEKNKIAAQKYRAKQRNEASDVAKRCDMFVSENAQLRGEIETTKKQIEEYKKLLAQLISPN